MEEQVFEIMERNGNLRTHASKEITSMVFEFMEWEEEKTEKVDNKYFVFKEILKWRTIYENVEFTNLNDLFQYWWDNVKNK
jgi:hypothetical protein